MKKGLFTSALVLPLVAMGLGTGAPVLAATTDDVQPTTFPRPEPEKPAGLKTSSANVHVEDGALELIQVPSLHFNTVTVKQLATQANTETGLMTRELPTIQLENFRSANKGWTLSAKLSDIAMVKNSRQKLSNTNIKMTLKNQSDKDANMPNQLPSGAVLNAGGAPKTLLSTTQWNDGFGEGEYRVDAKMNIGKQAKAAAGNYSGTITWTLSSIHR